MSAAKIILDSLMPTLGPWQADERGVIVLSVMPDVVVNIVEDETAEEVHLFSAAGYASGDDATSVELRSEDAGEGLVSVNIAEQTGLVMALRTLPRRELNEQAFVRELAGHVNFTRALAARLSPAAPQGGQAVAVAEDGATNWITCLASEGEAETDSEAAASAA